MLYPEQKAILAYMDVGWQCPGCRGDELALLMEKAAMEPNVEVRESDFRRLLAAIGQLLSDQKTIDQSGYMDNYTDAARCRSRMPTNVAELKAAYDLFAGPIPYRKG